MCFNPQTTMRGQMDPNTSLTSAREVIIVISKPMHESPPCISTGGLKNVRIPQSGVFFYPNFLFALQKQLQVIEAVWGQKRPHYAVVRLNIWSLFKGQFLKAI